MPLSLSYSPDPVFVRLGAEFADPVAPARFPQETVRFRNDRTARLLGLDSLGDSEWRSYFARFEPLPDNLPQPLAVRYHGHQFHVYNPDLGDGRGFLYAQLREAGTDRLLDLTTKGSGQTPYSRGADGRLTLKGAVREILATEMLEALGVPTSRTLTVIETGEDLVRGDEPSPTRSAVLTRVQHSAIRFGTFQRHAYHGRADLIQALADHVLDIHHPQLAEGLEAPARVLALFQEVVRRSAELTAAWMAAGFVHGVLNTDNLNINGESFDYGPYRFLPYNDPGFTAAYFDRHGLYAFGRQPAQVQWSLGKLAGVLAMVGEAEALSAALEGFGPLYHAALARAVTRRLGVASRGADEDKLLASAVFRTLAEGGEALRWEPLFFDWFGGIARVDQALSGPRGGLYRGPAGEELRARLADYAGRDVSAEPYFQRLEPEELLYPEIEALWAAITERDDWAPLNAKISTIREASAAYAIARTTQDL
jgi:serine/tyrosine/threonine adenylyltransferase